MDSLALKNFEIAPIKSCIDIDKFNAGPILWNLRTLCCGGVERQLSISLNALYDEEVTNIQFLCDSLDPAHGHDFFLKDVESRFSDIHFASEMPEHFVLEHASLLENCIKLLQWFPQDRLGELFLYVLWMLRIKPSIFHAWHGDFPIPALAACIAGVPKVILSGQSMSPRKRTPNGWEGPDVDQTFLVYKALCAYPSFKMTNNSNAGKDDYASWLGVDASRIYLTPNIVDIDDVSAVESERLRKELGLGIEDQVVGGIFRFVDIKDPGLWISTVAAVIKNKKNAVAVMWGDGPLLHACEKVVENMGMQDKILFPGKTKNSAAALSVCDVLLLTSFVEGLPNVVLEAQALGVPVVTTLAGGVADGLLDGRTGWICRKRCPLELADRILFVLENKDWSMQASMYAKKNIKKNFSIKSNIDLLKSVYLS